MKNQRPNSENVLKVNGSFHLKLIAKILLGRKRETPRLHAEEKMI